MNYLLCTALATAIIVAFGIYYTQKDTIDRLRNLYKAESRQGHQHYLDLLSARAEIRNLEEIRNMWATKAHELSDELRQRHMEHEGEVEILKGAIWKAEEFKRRTREVKSNYMRRVREAKKQ